MNEVEQISKAWEKATDFSKTFYGFPPLRDINRMRLTGQTEDWEYTYFLKSLLGDKLPVTSALSVFCGHGENEIRLAQAGVFQHCLAIDISTGALKNARANAEKAGVSSITFEEKDLNLPNSLPVNEFDLVIANGALHHSMAIVDLLQQIRHSMKSNALLLSSEYVGPDRYGRTYRQEQLIRAFQTVLPQTWTGRAGLQATSGLLLRKAWRTIVSNSEQIFRFANARRIQQLKQRDPSEAVHSSQVVSAVKQVFPSNAIHFYGGSLTSHVIAGEIMDAVNPENSLHLEFLNLLMRLEELLEEMGEISHCNAFIVAWKQ